MIESFPSWLTPFHARVAFITFGLVTLSLLIWPTIKSHRSKDKQHKETESFNGVGVVNTFNPLFVSVSNTPEKPKNGETCNGCGYCCASELCVAAEIALGEVSAPCPLMRFKDGRFWCGLVLTEKEQGMIPMISMSLGISIGCWVEEND